MNRMKYIKAYESLTKGEDIQNLKDILLEADDMGFVTEVRNTINYINVTIKTIKVGYSQKSFDFDEVKDCVLRLKDYAGDRYHEFDIMIIGKVGSPYWKILELSEDIVISYPIHEVSIWIKYLDSYF